MGSSDKARPYLLTNVIQNYVWGQKNEAAFIARLKDMETETDKPYAELWMGTHPNGPSQIIDPRRGSLDLADWIAEDPTIRLSQNRAKDFSGKLPYLFKVLSAEKMLSIQTHPNRQQAIELHRADPVHYPDENHKPEIAIAIDHLDALVGFVSDRNFQELLIKFPELGNLLDLEEPELQSGILKLLDLWSNSPESITACIETIYEKVLAASARTQTEQLLLDQVAEHGTGDIGILFILLLNYEHLEAGEAIFLGPGIPHAYLQGNIIECMANSDNVVRLGLTPKFCDAEALKNVLDFSEAPEIHINPESDGQLTEYNTPSKEFSVKSIALDEGDTFDLKERSELTMFLVLQGEIKLYWCSGNSSCCGIYQKGDSFVAPANLTEYAIQARQDSLIYLVELP